MIVNLSEEILSAEASGVLNWMLEGLAKLKADDWVLRLTAKQTKTVDDLLLQSDSSNVFVRECLESDEGGGTITSLDLFEAYSRYCRGRDWTALPRHKAGEN